MKKLYALSKFLWWEFDWQNRNSCADNTALYVELWVNGNRRYFKLIPQEVSADAYNSAWDRSSNESPDVETYPQIEQDDKK